MATAVTQQPTSAAPLDPHSRVQCLLVTAPDKARKGPETMKAARWFGAKTIRVEDYPKPKVTDPDDVIVRITCTTICGSDLHMYLDLVPGKKPMQEGDVLGHEGVGVIDDIGPNVRNLRRGDRVVVSAVISCGQCWYCRNEMFSLCDCTNPSKSEELNERRLSGIFGYTHIAGGFEGMQAEFVRVPFGERNCLVLPPEIPDEQGFLLSDVACTGWHGNELGGVKQGDMVAIWGCGPVGLMAAKWAKFRGATRVISIDNVPDRLDKARRLSGVDHTINFDDLDVSKTLRDLIPGGPDICIDCAGFRFPKTKTHRAQSLLKLETDALDIVTEMIQSCRKGGTVVLIGDYFGFGNQFPIGQMMETGLTMRGSQVFVQKYWRHLMDLMKNRQVDLSGFISPVWPFEKIAEAYYRFSNQDPEFIKVALKMPSSIRAATTTTQTSTTGTAGVRSVPVL